MVTPVARTRIFPLTHRCEYTPGTVISYVPVCTVHGVPSDGTTDESVEAQRAAQELVEAEMRAEGQRLEDLEEEKRREARAEEGRGGKERTVVRAV